jgi:hypothetical protein
MSSRIMSTCMMRIDSTETCDGFRFDKPVFATTSHMQTRSIAALPVCGTMRALRKVPEDTVYFWIVKLLSQFAALAGLAGCSS